MKTMYPAQVNSPGTELAAAIDAVQDMITVADGSVLPDGPNLLTIGTDEAAETILYTGKTGDELTGVTRGFQGTSQSWAAGTKVARYLTAHDVDAMRENIEENTISINHLSNLSPSVLKIPLSSDYRGWQGVAVHNDLIYVFSDRNETFGLENIISVYTLDGRLLTEKRDAYVGLDPQGKFMSFGDGNEIDGYLYVTAYNINSGGNPLISRVLKYTIPDLSIEQVYEIGSDTAESVTKHADSFWVVYHDVAVVREFNLDFNFVKEYPLDVNESPHGLFQGSLWEGNMFYANLHGHNFNESSPHFAELRKYEFDGTFFNFVESIRPPTTGCGQGICKYQNYYFWNDRANNMIVVAKKLLKGNIYGEIMPYQNEFSFKPPLFNGWEPYDTIYDRPARVTVLNNVVYLSGIIKNPTNPNAYDGNTNIFKMPYQYLPKFSLNLLALTDKGPIRIALVGKNSSSASEAIGNVNPQNIMLYENIGWISLDGICYPLTE